MQGSSLQTWVVIMIVSMAVALVAGVFAPRVSKEDKRRAEAFLYSTNKENVPTITISARSYFGWIILLLSASVVITAIFYFKESFTAAAASFGIGLVGEILIVLAVVFLSTLWFLVLVIVIVTAANIACADLEKYYQRHYGVKVKVLLPDK